MTYFYNRAVYYLSQIFVLLIVVVFSFQTAYSQQTEIFRSVGFDLNVDPMAISTDAGGMIDVNHDGWIDLFPGYQILLNNGVIDSVMQPFTFSLTCGLQAECRFADFNNDGWVDAYSTTQISEHDFLFLNQGDGVFIDAADSLGIFYPALKFTLACCLADYDNDGWVDILVGSNISAETGSGIWLWRNDAGKRFVNVADQMQVNVPSSWHGAVWADFDNDGDQDFFIAGGRKGDALFRNDGNKFVNIAEIAKTNPINQIGHSRSGAWGDYNNDGRLDLYVCDDEKMNRLFRNDGDGVVWPDVAQELHVANRDATGWALDKDATAGWGDYDNDGDLDLFTSSQGGEYNVVSENRLYRNDGIAGFVEIGHDMELADQGQTHHAGAFGDYDNDGDLDLYIIVGPSQLDPALGGGIDLLFENLIGSDNNWLEFRLAGVISNRSAIGARIKCVAGTLSQIREIQGGNGYNSMSPLAQHFGFGQATVIDSVVIRWPSGTVDRFFDVPVNQIIDVTEGSTSGVATRVTMPQTMELIGNYPNPFNPQTTIRFSLPKLELVTLKVLDVLGREVRALIDNRLLSGSQEVRWDGCDNARCPVATGIYLCRLIVDGKVMTHRMTLQK